MKRLYLAIPILALSACDLPDGPVDPNTARKVRRIAASDTIDGHFARVIMADGKITIKETQAWLDASDEIKRLGKPHAD